MGRQLSFLAARETLTAPPVFGGETTLSDSKQKGIVMIMEDGYVDVFYKGIEVGVPIANLRDWKYKTVEEAKYKKVEDGNKNKKV